MVSVISHIGLGIVFAEIYSRTKRGRESIPNKERIRNWTWGGLGGLAPDLDVIPAFILNLPIYAFHHLFTHTLIAVVLIIILLYAFKYHPYIIFFSIGYLGHLVTDLIDNSLTPLAPFLLFINEYGYIFSFELGLEIVEIFQANNWGFDTEWQFFSYYDMALIIMTFFLFIKYIQIVIRNHNTEILILE